MTNPAVEISPLSQARMAGIFAWISTTEGFALLVRSRLVVDRDATATAHNILAHELLYRSAIVGDVIAYVVSILYTLLLYNLFRPVSRRISLVAAVLSLVGLSIHLCICVFLLAPLVVLGGAQSLNQSQALALTFLNMHDDGYAVGMVLFGFYNILIGYLIFRSTFLPRILGVLLAISGLCYQIDNFAGFLWPAFQAHLEPYILLPGVAELLLALWLVVMGVNEQRWKEQASSAVEMPV
jgi:hypothetical protein